MRLHRPSSRPLVDLARQDGGKLVGEAFQALRLPIHLGGELVVENGRRDGGDKADGGRKQRFRDTRRDDRQLGVLRGGDRLEADMMPQTVPNRPTNGPAEPTVASTSRRRSSRSTSRAMETFITLSIRICRPAKERDWLSNERFHSRIAATKHAAIDCVGLADSAR